MEITDSGNTGSMYDLMNAGHVKLCLGKKKEALALYKQSYTTVARTGNTFPGFLKRT